MSLEPPAAIAILGGTPLGIEAALYGRFLGYRVEIFEREDSLATLRTRGAELLPGPVAEHSSPLGLAALAAQDGAYFAPAATATWTYQQWADLYLAALLRSDLLDDSLRPRMELTTIRREEIDASEVAADSPVAEDVEEAILPGFLLTFRDEARTESTVRTDALIAAGSAAATLIADHLQGPHVARLGRSSSGEPLSFAAGLGQIREFFAQLYDRADLDLYTRMRLG